MTLEEQLRHIDDRMTAVERKYSEAFDQATKLFQQSHNALTKWLTVFTIVFGVVFAIAVAAIGFQSFTTLQFQKVMMENFRETLEREKIISLRRLRILPYVAKIDLGRRTLRSGPEGQRDVAIWDDLLGTLRTTGSTPDFVDIVLEFKNVISDLPLVTEPEAFRNSYRGVIWIYIILLESGVDEVIDEIRRTAPSAQTLRVWAAQVQSKVEPRAQDDFKESIERLARGLRFGGRGQ